jgi:putative serine protease PepD
MTENYPGASGSGEPQPSPEHSSRPAQPAQHGQPGQPGQPAAEPTAGSNPDPNAGDPNPWSAGSHAYYPPTSQYQSAGGYGGYPPAGASTVPSVPAGQPQAPRRRGRVALIAVVAVLALVVGGVAGGVGGYLVSGSGSGGSGTVNALDQAPVNTAPASSTPGPSSGTVQAVASAVLPAVVEVSVQFQSNQGLGGDTGSGIVITSDGDILTNNHVIAAAAANNGQIQVIFQSGRTVKATIIGRDPSADVAVIKAQGASGLTVAQLGNSDSLQVGQQVVAIGAPYGLSGTVTSGIVSALHRPTAAGSSNTSNSQDTVMDAIQTDAAINPGNSGGPLVNMQGQVIGINSAIYSSGSASGQGGNVGIGFAIPVNQAQRLAQDIVTTGHSIQTYLGVSVTDSVSTAVGGAAAQDPQYLSQLEQAGLTNGALIKSVASGGPADKAGLKVGAVVVKVVTNGVTRLITNANGLVAAVRAAAPGNQMTLTLSDGSSITATLGGQPVAAN